MKKFRIKTTKWVTRKSLGGEKILHYFHGLGTAANQPSRETRTKLLRYGSTHLHAHLPILLRWGGQCD